MFEETWRVVGSFSCVPLTPPSPGRDDGAYIFLGVWGEGTYPYLNEY